MNQEINLTPSSINKFIKSLLEKNQYLTNISVVGEISNFKSSSGHFYFSIKDQEAQINCVMFKNNAIKLSFMPQDGMQVVIKASIYHNIKTGYYSLNVYALEEDGKGILQKRFEELKAKLELEGLFDPLNKQAIKPFNQRIALVTAPTSAAIKDMIATIKRRNPLADIIIVPTIVQGNKAIDSIISSIEYVNKHQLADVMIVGRGGGSIEDLWAFNEEAVARCVFESKIPIVSSVGHETDFTIIDFVADKRAATPTAAAEYVTIDVFDKQNQMDRLVAHMGQLLNNKVKYHQLALNNLITNQYFLDPLLNKKFQFDTICQKMQHNANNTRLKMQHQKQFLTIKQQSLVENMEFKIKQSKQFLCQIHNNLDYLNPLAILSRGYNVMYQNGNMVKDFSQLKVNDTIDIINNNKQINATVKEIKEQEWN